MFEVSCFNYGLLFFVLNKDILRIFVIINFSIICLVLIIRNYSFNWKWHPYFTCKCNFHSISEICDFSAYIFDLKKNSMCSIFTFISLCWWDFFLTISSFLSLYTLCNILKFHFFPFFLVILNFQLWFCMCMHMHVFFVSNLGSGFVMILLLCFCCLLLFLWVSFSFLLIFCIILILLLIDKMLFSFSTLAQNIYCREVSLLVGYLLGKSFL